MADKDTPVTTITTDIRLLKSEIESLNVRIQKINFENDDLLQRLSEAKRKREERETEFEEERKHLLAQIQLARNEQTNNDQSIRDITSKLYEEFDVKFSELKRAKAAAEQKYEDRELELKEHLKNARKEQEISDKVLKLEISELKEKLDEKTRAVEELRAENEFIQQNSVPLEDERELKNEVDTLRKQLNEKTKEVERQTQLLELDKKRLAQTLEEKENSSHKSMGKEQELLDRIAQLTAEQDLKESQLQIVIQEKTGLLSDKEDLEDVHRKLEQQLKSQIESLTTIVKSKEKDLQEKVDNYDSLSVANNRLQQNFTTLQASETNLHKMNTELDEKNGKLERALVRMKMDSDKFRSESNNQNDDIGLRNLLREKESHIEDLQKEVNTLQFSLRDRPVGTQRLRSQSRWDDYDGEETFRLRDPSRRSITDRYQPTETEDGGTIRAELTEAKKKLQFSGKRIAQMEKWLDEIYGDQDINLGPATSLRASTDRSAFSLPEIPQTGFYQLINSGTRARPRHVSPRKLTNSKKDWDHRTSLS